MRTIVEEEGVRQFIDELIESNPWVSDLYEGVKWRLSRDSEAGLRITGHFACL